MEGFRRLLTGLDTVQAAYFLRPTKGAAFSFEALMLAKEKARADKARDGAFLAIGGWSFSLRPYGSSSGYPLVLDHPHFTIECGEFNAPAFFVTFRSQALWTQGAQALHAALLTWGESVGLYNVRRESLSRVDFTFDYWLPTVDFTCDSVVSLSAKDSQHREDGRFQTLTYGKSDIVLRIYDKVAEILQQSDKVWLYELWGATENVWRIEWQVRKEILHRFGIRNFDDLFGGQGDLLRYLATEHDSLRVPTSDSNRSRWPLHPLWRDLIAQIDVFNCQGVYREIDAQAALNAQLLRIAISVYGYCKRVAAILSVQTGQESTTLGQAEAKLGELIGDVHDPLSWRVDVASKRNQTLLGRLR